MVTQKAGGKPGPALAEEPGRSGAWTREALDCPAAHASVPGLRAIPETPGTPSRPNLQRPRDAPEPGFSRGDARNPCPGPGGGHAPRGANRAHGPSYDALPACVCKLPGMDGSVGARADRGGRCGKGLRFRRPASEGFSMVAHAGKASRSTLSCRPRAPWTPRRAARRLPICTHQRRLKRLRDRAVRVDARQL